LEDPRDLARRATARSSSRFLLHSLGPGGKTAGLDLDRAILLPVPAGPMPAVTLYLDAAQPATLDLELRTSSRPGNFTPDLTLARRTAAVAPGHRREVAVDFGVTIDQPRYVLICLMNNPALAAHLSDTRVTGLLSLSHKPGARQRPPEGIGIDSFECWVPKRRPDGHNLAFSLSPTLDPYRPENVLNGIARPASQPNAWVAAPDDPRPWLELKWEKPQSIVQVDLTFDTDFDHPMESVLLGHPEADMPFCVKHYRLLDSRGRVLAEISDNHQTRNRILLPEPVVADSLRLEILETRGAPAAVFEVRCYASAADPAG